MMLQTYRNAALAVWCVVFVRAVQATTLAEFMGPYDPDLKFWALAFALLGGALRSIMSWQGDTRAIYTIARGFAWNMFHAALAGFAAFMVIQAMRGSGMAIASEVRVGSIVLAGWHGKTALTFILDFAKSLIKKDTKP